MQALGLLIQARIPSLAWGSPGTGKTSVAAAIAARVAPPVEVVLAALREPGDFLGLPLPSEDHGRPVIRRAIEGWARRLLAAGKGTLLLDELTSSAPAVQAALLRVVLERVVGEETLSAAVSVVCLANPEDIAAGGWQLAAPLANRVIHLDWEVDPTAWATAAIAGYPVPEILPLPETWRAQIPASRALVASYIRRNPSALLSVPKDEAKRSRAYPTPRSWDMASQAEAAAVAAHATVEVRHALVIGAVGAEAGGEYLTYRDALDLPDPEELLADPSSYKPDRRGDHASATLASLVAAVTSTPSKDRWLALWAMLRVHAKLDRGICAPSAGAAFRLLKGYGGQIECAAPRDVAEWLSLLAAAGVAGGGQ